MLSAGAVLYAAGLALMGTSWGSTPLLLDLTAGVTIGFGLAGASFTIVLGAFGRLFGELEANARRIRAHQERRRVGAFEPDLAIALVAPARTGWLGHLDVRVAVQVLGHRDRVEREPLLKALSGR